MVRLSPPAQLGEFFGIYGLVGKGSQVIGSLLYGMIVFLLMEPLGNRRLPGRGVSLLVTMLIGLWLIWPVRDDWTGGDDGPTAARTRAGRAAGALARHRADRAARGSVRVAAGVRSTPGPGRSDHLLERRLARPPAEHRLRTIG